MLSTESAIFGTHAVFVTLSLLSEHSLSLNIQTTVTNLTRQPALAQSGGLKPSPHPLFYVSSCDLLSPNAPETSSFSVHGMVVSCSEKARMVEDSTHNRGRREGTTLLRALLATFKWRLVVPAACLLGESAFHIAQVRGGVESATDNGFSLHTILRL